MNEFFTAALPWIVIGLTIAVSCATIFYAKGKEKREILMFLVFLVAVFRYLDFRVQIGVDGFYFQTMLQNGRYFKYSDIMECWEKNVLSEEARA